MEIIKKEIKQDKKGREYLLITYLSKMGKECKKSLFDYDLKGAILRTIK